MPAVVTTCAPAGPLDWQRHGDGYQLVRGNRVLGPRLSRQGRDWLLEVDGQSFNLGRRATFDTAERRLASMGWLPAA
jgi:hypothetical protein